MKYTINISKKRLLLFSSIFLLAMVANGQRTITGTLTDSESGETLIGASVLAVGTSIGASTDIDGTFRLEIPEGVEKLKFSYTGYQTQTVDLGVSNVINVQMKSGEILDEVVVIGYGTTKKEDATGSIQTVDESVFNKGAITSPQELLAGKVAGVSITTNSGAPGAGAVIRIRGGSSLNASNDPLIVIDGIPIDNSGTSGSRNSLNLLNPNDIETFTVLKDASATAIYGSRASNGVILITTKKGNLSDKMSINYNGNISFSNITKKVDVFSADEFRSFITKTYGEGSSEVNALGGASTDWQDEIYNSAVGHDHNISVSGGIAEVLPYRISLGYTDKAGILETDKFERTTAAINLSPGFLDNTLQLNLNFKGMWTKNKFASRGAIGSAIAFDPTQSILDENSPYQGYFTYFADSLQNPNRLAPTNPRALLDLIDDRSNVARYVMSGSIDYRLPFFPDLRANLNLGLDYSKGEGENNIPADASFAYNPLTGGGTDNEYNQTKRNELLEFYLNYAKEFGDHKVDLMGGYSWQHFFINDAFKNSDIAGTPSETVDRLVNTLDREYYLLSFFGRFNYTFKDKYLFTFTSRNDASSRFSPENRWGWFPAGAFAYKAVTNRQGNFNNLKIRLGIGLTGQQDIGSSHANLDYYAYQSVYTLGVEGAQYQFGDTYVSTLRAEEYDQNIKWEVTTTYNVGVDFGFFKNRLSGSLDYYYRPTRDLLNRIPVPAGTNLSNFVTTNVGNLENEGIELSLNWVAIETKDLTWDIGANGTYNRNEITKLTATDDPEYLGVKTGGIAGGVGSTIQIHSVGYPAFSYYVNEQVYDDNGLPIEGLFVDRNGDGEVTPEDAYRHEFNRAPDFFFGFTTALNYKNFTFSAAARSNIGNYVYNNVESDRAFYNRIYTGPDVLLNSLAEIENIGWENPQYLSDHFVQNASFLRLDHITASYRFDNIINDSGSITISATLQNPIVITPYTGIDPEIFSGVDSNIYPRTRTILFGVSAAF